MSQASIIKSLYEASTGKSVDSFGYSRLQESTRTLLDHEVAEKELLTKKEDIMELPIEKAQYAAIINRVERMTSLHKNNIVQGQLIHIIETDKLRPTGRAIMKTVGSVTVGTDSNGVKSGWSVILWE